MPQRLEKKARGRPRLWDKKDLLQWERLWIELFSNLRDGAPQMQTQASSRLAIFIKASHDQEKLLVGMENETLEVGGRETIYTLVRGEKPQIVRQPKIIESPREMQRWKMKAQRVEENFQRLTGEFPRTETIAARPAERHIWDALKRAKTAAEVRRAYSRSRIWLKSRTEYPGGGFHDWSWSPYPRELYRRAEEFCRAKRDSRYPARDSRKSGDYRRIEYLARVMAGLSLKKAITPSYSIEVFRKMKHTMRCNCWRCTLKLAPRYRRSLAQFLSEGTLNEADARTNNLTE